MERGGFTSIAISGLPASGKSVLAKKLAEIFDMPVYSVGQFWREKYKQLYPNREIPFEQYWRKTTFEENQEADRNSEEVLKKGKVIGDLRYPVYCRNLPVLLVFVTADLETRARRAVATGKYNGQPVEEIQKILFQREADEVRTGKQLYGDAYDYRNPDNYHLVLNSGLMTVEEEVAVVRSFLEK